jgi:hypothetical protein
MGKEDDVDQLIKDAVFYHLVRNGKTDFQAEYEASKYMMQKKKK